MSNKVSIFLATAAALALSGCAGSTGGVSTPAPVNNDPGYQAGYRDGCTTAHGEYKKNSELFKSDKNYYDGWFAGRSSCQYK